MRETTIRTEGLSKRFGGDERGGEPCCWAVREVSLTARAGELVVLMGPSGSGKTTLLSMAGGLLAPTEGRLTVCGQSLENLDESARQRFRRAHLGFVFQSCNLLDALTAEENVRIALSLRDADEAQSVDLLARVGLAEKALSFPRELSGGQRQRVAVARALAGSPSVILADEPTAALDAERGRQIMKLLADAAHQDGTAVLVVTHDPRLRKFADRIVEMEDGRIHKIFRTVVMRRERSAQPVQLAEPVTAQEERAASRTSSRRLRESAHVRADVPQEVTA